MWTLLVESTLVGFITWIIGTIIFNLDSDLVDFSEEFRDQLKKDGFDLKMDFHVTK